MTPWKRICGFGSFLEGRLWFLGHTQCFLGQTPGSEVRDHTWWPRRIIWDIWNLESKPSCPVEDKSSTHYAITLTLGEYIFVVLFQFLHIVHTPRSFLSSNIYSAFFDSDPPVSLKRVLMITLGPCR